jgi:hypothetical protein
VILADGFVPHEASLTVETMRLTTWPSFTVLRDLLLLVDLREQP